MTGNPSLVLIRQHSAHHDTTSDAIQVIPNASFTGIGISQRLSSVFLFTNPASFVLIIIRFQVIGIPYTFHKFQCFPECVVIFVHKHYDNFKHYSSQHNGNTSEIKSYYREIEFYMTKYFKSLSE